MVAPVGCHAADGRWSVPLARWPWSAGARLTAGVVSRLRWQRLPPDVAAASSARRPTPSPSAGTRLTAGGCSALRPVLFRRRATTGLGGARTPSMSCWRAAVRAVGAGRLQPSFRCRATDGWWGVALPVPSRSVVVRLYGRWGQGTFNPRSAVARLTAGGVLPPHPSVVARLLAPVGAGRLQPPSAAGQLTAGQSSCLRPTLCRLRAGAAAVWWGASPLCTSAHVPPPPSPMRPTCPWCA